MLRSPDRSSVALLAVFFAGGLVSSQVFFNGRLAEDLGSPELAGCVNHSTGVAALLLAALIRGVPARAARRVAVTTRPRWWHLLGGLNGGFFIILAGYAAPRVGIALLTVAFVCGQTTGSLFVDMRGLGAGGVRPLTVGRVIGGVIALVAVTVGGLGSPGHVDVGLLSLALLAGAGVAVQQAAMGHVASITGEPMAAGVVNLLGGLVVVACVTAVVGVSSPPGGWPAPSLNWIGGVLGSCVAVIAASTVGRLGVLRMMLALVAGQSAGGLVLDLVAPPPEGGITAATLLSVALTIAAVVISSTSRAPRPSP